MSVRYPAAWRSDQAEQEGVWYRYFLPPAGGDVAALSATLLVGPLTGTLEDYAQTYLAGHSLASARDERRQGARARSYDFATTGDDTRYSLLLVEDSGRVLGLYCQGKAEAFARFKPQLDEMQRSLTLERAELYPERRDAALGYSLRVPASWPLTRQLGSGQTQLVQFTSPPLAAERNQVSVHASLTLSVEPVEEADSLDGYYDATRRKLGDSFRILRHTAWRGGYADLMRTETPVAESQVKRFYRVAGSRGYSLAFEARSDVFSRVSGWCDLIAGSLKVGSEVAP